MELLLQFQGTTAKFSFRETLLASVILLLLLLFKVNIYGVLLLP